MKTKASLSNGFLFLAAACTLIISVAAGKETARDGYSCNFPAIYMFGDSNSDTGEGSAAFYEASLPAGETFFHRGVGRGCDGRIIIDFIAEQLGLPYLSAYLDSIGTSFRHGSNFAMGGTTIRPQNESMSLNGVPPFSLDVQVSQFNNFKSRSAWFFKKDKNLRKNLPRPDEFPKALYVLDIGQNDVSAGIRLMTKLQFIREVPDIVKQFGIAVEKLYKKGARTFWVHNTGPIGCLAVTLRGVRDPDPGYLDRHGCVNDHNDRAKEFNRQLKAKVNRLRGKLPHAALTYVDVYSIKYRLITNAKKQGFLDKKSVCCGYHEKGIHIWCGKKLKVNGTTIHAGSCHNPSAYVSWDGVHYTEAANRWITNRIINGSMSDPPLPLARACRRSPH